MDLALGFSALNEAEHPELDEICWLKDDYVAISHAGRSRLTLADYLAAQHLVVTPWNESQGVLDVQLTKMGFARHITIKTPSMLSAPFIIAQSELLMAIPRSAAEKMLGAAKLKVFELPFEVPPFEVKIYSHKRSGQRGASQWLKAKLREWAAAERA